MGECEASPTRRGDSPSGDALSLSLSLSLIVRRTLCAVRGHGMSHVEPLPQELANVRHAARAAHAVNQQHVDSVIARLERARDCLAHADAEAGPADELLSLSSYLKQSGAESQATHKEWANAVNRLAKSVEKVCPPPPFVLAERPTS